MLGYKAAHLLVDSEAVHQCAAHKIENFMHGAVEGVFNQNFSDIYTNHI